jgi:hypothetical protein
MLWSVLRIARSAGLGMLALSGCGVLLSSSSDPPTAPADEAARRDGGGTPIDGSADAGVEAAADAGVPDAAAGARYVFVSKARFDGRGVAGANAACTGEALDARLPAGTYVAFVANGRALTAGAPWRRPDGTIVLDGTFAPIVDSTSKTTLLAPISQNADGAIVSASSTVVWVGAAQQQACDDWSTSDFGVSGGTGDSSKASVVWDVDTTSSCQVTHPVYCFQL